MSLKLRQKDDDDAELDVTAFLNLMIVLVPVLLLSMTFAKITVLEIRLPELTGGSINSIDTQSKLEVVVDAEGYKVYFPENVLQKSIPVIENEKKEKVHDYEMLSLTMQAIKEKAVDKKDVLLKLQKDTDYQVIVKTMDSVKSFKTVVISSLVEQELFPEISLGDAG